jgi:signal transduction histidine kinase
VETELVDIDRLVRDAVSTAALGGARVRADVASGLPHVKADPIRLRQALDNLIANARLHGGEEDEIAVAARLEGSQLLISVHDHGPGIPGEKLTAIFEAGVRLDTESTGHGLGLGVTRAIAEAHGGTVAVRSVQGGGSTFTIALPIG